MSHSSQPFAHPSLGKCFFSLAELPPSTQWNATPLSQPIRQQRTCFCDHRSSSHTSLADFQLSLTISISFINWSSTHLTRTLEVRLYIFPSPLQPMASSRPGYRNEPLIATSHPLQTDQRRLRFSFLFRTGCDVQPATRRPYRVQIPIHYHAHDAMYDLGGLQVGRARPVPSRPDGTICGALRSKACIAFRALRSNRPPSDTLHRPVRSLMMQLLRELLKPSVFSKMFRGRSSRLRLA